uniref:Chemokine interleukin-8-like domain-containing protein n=1 Tax=Equus asinus TaxID=9793 RepID=A0A8C4PMJ7_EQUAS
MEVPMAALAVLLLTAALCSHTCSASFGADTPTTCCFSYISRQIPCKFVDDDLRPAARAPSPIFHTKRGWQVCADPSESWVQDISCPQPAPLFRVCCLQHCGLYQLVFAL